MKCNRQVAWAVAIAVLVTVQPAHAGLAPYARLDYGGNQLKMSEGNDRIELTQTQFQESGYPASFKKIGSGYGVGGAAGLWLFPAFRLGATASQFRAVRRNHLHVPGRLYYAQDLDFRMTEFGAEAALRFRRLAGFTVGGRVASGRAKMIEGLSFEDAFGQYYEDATATRTRTTYGAFVGIDQTNDMGVAGYVQVGWQSRDMGRMPSTFTESDGVNTASGTGATIPLDYGGVYVKVGVGYDFAR